MANTFTRLLVQLYTDGKIPTSKELYQYITEHASVHESEMEYGTQTKQPVEAEMEVSI